MSNKLKASKKKVTNLIMFMHKKGINGHYKEDKRWADSTPKTYIAMIHSLQERVHEKHGIANLFEIKLEHVQEYVEERIDAFHNGETKEAYNLHTFVSAITALQYGQENTKAFKEDRIDWGTKVHRQTMKENYVIRHSAASSVGIVKPQSADEMFQLIKEGGRPDPNTGRKGYQTKTREAAYHLSKLQYATGGRIGNLIKKSTPSCFYRDEETGQCYVDFNKDKGKKDRSTPISEETYRYAQELSEGKGPNDRLFVLHKRDGTFKSVPSSARAIERVIEKDCKEFGYTEKVRVKDREGNAKIIEVKKNITSHSFRKGFALNRTYEYGEKFTSKEVIDRYIDERMKKDPKIEEKLDMIRQRINKYKYDKAGNLKTNPKTGKPYELRDLTKEEYAIFFTSLDLGHYRTDVVEQFYADWLEVKSVYESQQR